MARSEISANCRTSKAYLSFGAISFDMDDGSEPDTDLPELWGEWVSEASNDLRMVTPLLTLRRASFTPTYLYIGAGLGISRQQ